MNRPYIAVIVDLATHYGRNAFRGVDDYNRLQSGGFEVVLQNRLAWQERKPVGVIGLFDNEQTLKMLQAGRLQVVNMSDQIPRTRFPTVVSDAREVGRLAALHLLAAGFRHFGFYSVQGSLFNIKRGQGFIQALQAKGKQCESCLAAPRRKRQQSLRERIQLKQWIARLPKPVGIFCSYDWMAWFIYDVCKEAGIRIPCDVALVGVDNDELLCETYTPPLSSVDVDAKRIGREAAALLFRLLDGKSAPSQPILVKPLGVVQRPSSDVFISSDPHISTVAQYIRQHVDEPLKVATLLKLAPLSRRVLERRFSRGLGWSMRAEIHRCKIERVKQLLAGTNLLMTKIAAKTGFASLSHMSFLFHKETGLTLQEYRRNFRH